MDVTLTDALSEELSDTLDEVLGDLSTEIAGTDNAHFRATLERRRGRLIEIRSQLATAP